MIFNIHAGHNPDGKTACGAVGILKESTEARAIAAKVIEKLWASGHTAYDCTVNDGTSKDDVLSKIVAKCNQNSVDVDVSIHLNSGRNDCIGDGSTGGTEVFLYTVDSKAKPYAQKVAMEISALGFRLRDDEIKDDIKTSSSLYVLKNTKAPAMLIECFFVDDKDDVDLYQKIGGAEGIANAIVKGLLTNAAADPAPAAPSAQTGATKEVWGVVTGNGINVRKGPGTSYGIVGQVNNGRRVRIWKESGNWYMVDTDKWICATYVRKEANVTSNANPVASSAPSASVSSGTIAAGKTVRVKGTATEYATGQTIPNWVKNRTHTVQKVKDDRALLKEIQSWVKISDLDVAGGQ